MSAFLFPVFNYVRDNTWAQVVVLLGFGWFVLKLRDRWRDKRTKERVLRRVEKQSRKVQSKIQEKSNEISKQVAVARDNIRNAPDLSSAELPDDEFEQLFGFRRNSRVGAG